MIRCCCPTCAGRVMWITAAAYLEHVKLEGEIEAAVAASASRHPSHLPALAPPC